MDRPDFKRRQGVDRFFYEYGLNVYGGPHPAVPTGASGWAGCSGRPLANGRLLVIAYEHPDNPGRSVTQAAEDIAGQSAEAGGVDVSRPVWVGGKGSERAASGPRRVRGCRGSGPAARPAPPRTRVRGRRAGRRRRKPRPFTQARTAQTPAGSAGVRQGVAIGPAQPGWSRWPRIQSAARWAAPAAVTTSRLSPRICFSHPPR